MSVLVKPISADIAAIQALCTAIDLKTTNLPASPADEDGAIARKYPFLDFWSANEDNLVITNGAANILFKDIVVSGLPSGYTIRRVVLIMTCRALEEDSGFDNYVNAAGKAIRVMKSGGNWATQSIVGITFDNQSLYCAANSKENGPVIIGDDDIKSIVDGNGTFNVMSNNDDTGDAVVVLAASMYLYDVQVGLRVFYS